MYASIRKYSKIGSVDKIEKKVRDGLIPILKQNPGFSGFYAIDCGGGVLVSISVFDSKDSAQKSNQQAIDFIKKNLLDEMPNPPEILVGETRISESA